MFCSSKLTANPLALPSWGGGCVGDSWMQRFRGVELWDDLFPLSPPPHTLWPSRQRGECVAKERAVGRKCVRGSCGRGEAKH
jgi:hypothetical protein